MAEIMEFAIEWVARGAGVVLFIVCWQLIRKYNLERWVMLAVRAAEQIFAMPEMGEVKKDWVIEQVTKRFKFLSPEMLDVYIEAAVQQINQFKEKNPEYNLNDLMEMLDDLELVAEDLDA